MAQKLNRLRAVLKEKGIKAAQLAKMMGKAPQQIGMWVRNEHQPNLRAVYQIAKVLEMDACDLLINPNPLNCEHQFEDVPSANLVIRQCVNCGETKYD